MKNNQRLDIKPRITSAEIEYVIKCSMVNTNYLNMVIAKVKPEHFRPDTEYEYIVLWRSMLKVVEDCSSSILSSRGKLKTLLELECNKLLKSAPQGVSDCDGLFFNKNGDPEGLIHEIANTKEGDIDEFKFRTLLEDFLNERLIVDPLQKLIDSIGRSNSVKDIDSIIDNIKSSRESITSVSINPVEETFQDNWWDSNEIVQMPTNIPFLDVAMDGGPALGEVMALLGPTGGGKTLLGIMLAVNGARYQTQLHSQGKDSGYWYYFSYESPITPDIRSRVLGYAAEIHSSITMKSLKNLGMLSTSNNLKDYELKRWSKKIALNEPVAGELERYKAATAQLGDRLKLVDMSGSKHPSVGTGGIAEVARILSDGLSKGHKPVGIVIDYAGICVDRYMAQHNEKVENQFHYLNSFVNNIRVSVAQKFNCIVWVLHQLHGDASAASPTTKQHHSKARGARNFADNTNFAFNIGVRDDTTGCCIITCSKHRRSEGVKEPPIVIVDGAFGAMIPNDGRFTMDSSQRRIVDKELADMIADSNVSKPNKPSGFGLSLDI